MDKIASKTYVKFRETEVIEILYPKIPLIEFCGVRLTWAALMMMTMMMNFNHVSMYLADANWDTI